MEHRFVDMTAILGWWNERRREWRAAKARRNTYREIAALPEQLRIDLTARHQKM
ncbi:MULTISPECIES: hypothetical protein [unclassified Rhizobium]|uniref:hypothetical protein n=1 Tax=unclassified Rhizobium TaxID=2613769 RepID=UPI000B28B0C1|nr:MULTISPECIES: hypothetical protein [unclassified Rhizobium]